MSCFQMEIKIAILLGKEKRKEQGTEEWKGEESKGRKRSLRQKQLNERKSVSGGQ